jgi:hypothetical protein
MTQDPKFNFGYGTVLTPPSPVLTGTSLVLNSGQGARFPAVTGPTEEYNLVFCPPGVLPLLSNAEIVRVTAHTASSDTLQVFTRAQEGTSAKTITTAWQVFRAITKNDWDNLFKPIFVSETILTNPGGAGFALDRHTIGVTHGPSNAAGDYRLLGLYLITQPVASDVNSGATGVSLNIERNGGGTNVMAYLRGLASGVNWNRAGATVQELRGLECIYYCLAGTVTTAMALQVRRGAAGSGGAVTYGVGIAIETLGAPIPSGGNFAIWSQDTGAENIFAGQMTVGADAANASTATIEIYEKTPAAGYSGIRAEIGSPAVMNWLRYKDFSTLIATDKVAYFSTV